MNKIGPDGTSSTSVFNDFSIFSLNNINIGQYAGKIIQGSNNTILGQNAGIMALDVNDNILLGFNSGSLIKSGNSNISIGNDNTLLPEINNCINIGDNYINSTNSITIGSNLINDSSINNDINTIDIINIIKITKI